MSIAPTWQIESTSSAATLALGEQIGHKLKGGEVFELIGDLGCGKTTFVKGLAQGIGSSDHVHSPSFNIENIYIADELRLHHFDLYRLQDPSSIKDQLQEVIMNNESITVIEWPATLMNDVFNKKITVKFKATSELSRQLTFKYDKSLSYCMNRSYRY